MGGPPPASADLEAFLADLSGRADALRMTGARVGYSLSAGAETIGDAYVEGVTCSGARCEAAAGAVATARDLLDPAGVDPAGAGAAVDTRGGFGTVVTRGVFEETQTLPGLDLTVSVSSEVTSYGFWGDHGFAALSLGAGPVTAEIDGASFSGGFSTVQAYAAGDASGMNPSGPGGATWTGIVEASPTDPTGGFERLTGTATVTIADLSRPRVGVAIDIPGHAVGAPGWSDMPLEDGGFSSGTAGTDWIGGHFHGPGHEEAWGVFDTADHVGAFGARRTR